MSCWCLNSPACPAIPTKSRDLLTKLSSLRLGGQIYGAKSHQQSKKKKQRLTGLSAMGDSMASLEYSTCSFFISYPTKWAQTNRLC